MSEPIIVFFQYKENEDCSHWPNKAVLSANVVKCPFCSRRLSPIKECFFIICPGTNSVHGPYSKNNHQLLNGNPQARVS